MKPYFRCVLILVLILFLISPGVVWANSGPTYWQGYPSSEVLTVDQDCPIGVIGEKLFFDFSDDSIRDYTIWGKVTAAYRMVNPTDQDLNVQMAFPFITSLRDFSPDDVVITADGVNLPYELYLGNVVNSRGSSFQEESGYDLAFENILSTITSEAYQAQHFKENEKGLLYTLEVAPTSEQRVNFTVDFELDEDKTKVLTKGFNRYERKGNKVRIASWCYEAETLEILVLGSNIKFNINAYTDGELIEETDLYTYKISSQEVELMSFIKKYIEEYHIKFRGESDDPLIFTLDEVQFYNLYGKALNQAFTVNQGYAICEDLTAQDYSKRVFILVYNVDFPANSQKNVAVNYRVSGTMDRTRTTKPVYSFQYLLNPAQNWSSFGDLDIEIITPEEAPYIVESSLELNNEGERLYKASFNSLPPGDLTFSLYGKEKISVLEKVYVSLRGSIIFLGVLLIFVGVALVLGRSLRLLMR